MRAGNEPGTFSVSQSWAQQAKMEWARSLNDAPTYSTARIES
jgi:hypothetical protein